MRRNGKNRTTVQRGDEFEALVFKRLSKVISELGFSNKNAKLKRRPRYFSRDRNAQIIFDVSAECGKDPKMPAFTVVVECKDYKHAVPVNDVEEFKAKLDQCFGKNVKAVLAVSGAVQEGALTYARSQGIAVVRIFPDHKVGVVAYKLGSGVDLSSLSTRLHREMAARVDEAITDPKFHGAYRNFRDTFDTFGAYKSKNFTKLDNLVRTMIGPVSRS
jgi:hypothetical protein